MSTDLRNLVASEAERAGLVLNLEQQEGLESYLQLLHHWGKRINLTARSEPEVVVQRLLPDTLVLAANLPESTLTVVDVGSGSGLLGLVLAVLQPRLQILLLEPNGRKCSFLRTAIHKLQLHQVTVQESRLEQVKLLPRQLACSRATWAPAQWLQLAGPLVEPEGLVATFVVGEDDLPRVPGFALQRQLGFSLHDRSPRLLAFYQPMFHVKP